MNVEELLDMLEETLEEGTAVPFAITCPMNCATAKRLWQTASRF